VRTSYHVGSCWVALALFTVGLELTCVHFPRLQYTVQSKSSDPLSKLLQQNTGRYKDTRISSIFDLWQLTLPFWLSLDAFTTIESEMCEKCEQIKDASSQWQGGGVSRPVQPYNFQLSPRPTILKDILAKVALSSPLPPPGRTQAD